MSSRFVISAAVVGVYLLTSTADAAMSFNRFNRRTMLTNRSHISDFRLKEATKPATPNTVRTNTASFHRDVRNAVSGFAMSMRRDPELRFEFQTRFPSASSDIGQALAFMAEHLSPREHADTLHAASVDPSSINPREIWNLLDHAGMLRNEENLRSHNPGSAEVAKTAEAAIIHHSLIP